jgi:crotonobetaine/carnitine-CoA ligase
MADLVANRTLPLQLRETAAAGPDRTFMVFEDRDGGIQELTYGALLERVQRTAQGFAELGIGRGDKVCVHLRNCPEFVFAFLALAELGAVMVPSNVANRSTEMTYVLNHAEVKLAVTAAEFVELFAAVAPAAPGLTGIVVVDPDESATAPVPLHSFAAVAAAEPRAEPEPVDAEAPVQILFTSGTTAAPKGVVLTHANCLWSGERESRHYRFREDDRLLTALPLFHVNAQSFGLLPALCSGSTMVLLGEYRATKFWGQVRRHRATHTSIVAMLLRTLLRQPVEAEERDHCLRTLNYAINVSDAEKNEFEARFGVELINGYGLSEAMVGVTAAPLYGDRRWPSIGLPVVDRDVRIIDAEGRELPAGEVGEIVVKGVPGRTIAKEYYRDPEATAAAIVDGWLHTGDNGYVDELGYFFFFDRKKDVIKRAGENVSASEVEAVLLDHPAVTQAGVLGVPDPIRDEAVKAFVAVAEGLEVSEEELTAFCAARLARFKVPTVFEFRSSLPQTSVGKVEKKALRDPQSTGAQTSVT